MYEIKIYLLSLIRKRKISISSRSLRKIIRFVGKWIFAKYHASDKGFGSTNIVGIGIIFLQKIFEIGIVMISKFDEHKHIWIVIRNSFFYSNIIYIVFVNIGKQYFQASRLGFLLNYRRRIKMIKLFTIPKKQYTEYKKRATSKITLSGGTISWFHFLLEIYKTYHHKQHTNSRYIRQKTHHQFCDIVSRKK